jgi:hypothetical protein
VTSGAGRWRESGGGAAKGGEWQRPGPAGCGPREVELGRAAVDDVGAGGRGSGAGAGHRSGGDG